MSTGDFRTLQKKVWRLQVNVTVHLFTNYASVRPIFWGVGFHLWRPEAPPNFADATVMMAEAGARKEEEQRRKKACPLSVRSGWSTVFLTDLHHVLQQSLSLILSSLLLLSAVSFHMIPPDLSSFHSFVSFLPSLSSTPSLLLILLVCSVPLVFSLLLV